MRKRRILFISLILILSLILLNILGVNQNNLKVDSTYNNSDNDLIVLDNLYGGKENDEFNSVIQTKDGGYIAVGHTNSTKSGEIVDENNGLESTLDALIVKFDKEGNHIWDNVYGGYDEDEFIDVVETKKGNYIAIGNSKSTKSGEITDENKYTNDLNQTKTSDGLIVEFDKDGNILYDDLYGTETNEYLNDIIPVDDGFVIVGQIGADYKVDKDIFDSSNGNYDGLIIKLDKDGDHIWDNVYGGPGVENFNSVAKTKDGGYLVAGKTESSYGGEITSYNSFVNNGLIVKFDKNGKQLWDKQYGTKGYESLSSIIATEDNNYLVVGETFNKGNGDILDDSEGAKDALIIKIDKKGEILWSNSYGGIDDEAFNSVIEYNNEYIAVGYSTSNKSGEIDDNNNSIYNEDKKEYPSDGLIVKFDREGKVLYDNLYGGDEADNFIDVIKTKNKGYAFVGGSKSNKSGEIDDVNNGKEDALITIAKKNRGLGNGLDLFPNDNTKNKGKNTGLNNTNDGNSIDGNNDDGKETSNQEKVILSAADIKEKEVNSTLTKKEAKDLFDVSVSDNSYGLGINDVNVNMDNVNLNKIGTYNIIFSIDDGLNKSEFISKLKVVDTTKPVIKSDSNKNIYINNFQNDKEIKSLFNVSASDNYDGDISDKIIVDQSQVDYTKIGTYKITFSVRDSSLNFVSKEVDLNVLDSKLNLEAQDIYTNMDTISNQKDINKFLLNNANIKLTGDDSKVKVKSTNLKPNSSVGIYDATFEATDNLKTITKDIKIYVANKSDVVDNDKPYLYANNIVVNKGIQVNNKDFNAIAFDKQDGDITNKIIYPNVNVLKTGVYPGVLSVEDSENNVTDLTKYITIVGEDSTISPGGDIFLEANNIYTNVEYIKSITDIDKFIIEESNSFAQSTNDGSVLDVSVEYTNLSNKSSVGIYDATLVSKTKDDMAKKEIKIYVADKDDITDNDKPYLFAKNITVNKYDVISNNLYGAVAFDKQDGDITNKIIYPSVDTSSVGVYPANFSVVDSSNNKTQITKYVTVKDDSSVISPDDNLFLSANDIYTNVDTLKSSSDINKFIIDNSKAFAKNMQDGSDVKVDVDNTTLYTNSPVGIYDANLSANSGSSKVQKDIKIYVANGSDVVDDDKPYLYANNIRVNKGEKIDNSMYRAIAFDRQDGDLTSSIIYPNVDTSLEGVYPAKFGVLDNNLNKTELTKYVTVLGDNSIVSPDENVYLYAEDFSINKLDLYSTTDINDMIIKNSNASAYNVNNGKLIDVNIKDTNLNKDSKPGEYEANLIAKSGNLECVKKIKIVVKDVSLNLEANDIYTSENELSKQTDINKFLLDNSGAKAEEKVEKKLKPIKVKETTLKPNSPIGIYDATFEVSNELDTVEKGIKVYVTKGNSIVDNEKPYLYAKNLQVNKNDIINDIDYSAIAFDRQDGDLTNKIIYPNVDTSSVGVYPANFSVVDSSNNKTKLTKYVTVKDDNSVISPDEKVFLSANDIYTNVDALKASTDINKFIIDNSKAFAKNMQDGSDVKVDVKSTTLNKDSSVGIYDANLSANSGASSAKKDIKIYVANGSDIVDNDKPYIYAKNIIVNKNDKIENSMYKAIAFDRQDGDLTSEIQYPKVKTDKTGVYPAKFIVNDKDSNETELTKYVTVKDDSDVISPDDKIFLEANDIFTNTDNINVSSDINQFILDKSNAYAKNTSNGNDIEVKVEETNLTQTSPVGIYDAKLVASEGTSKSLKNIKIYVTEAPDHIDDNNPYLYAKNITVNKGDFVNNDLYQAIAFDKEDGNLTNKIKYPIVDTSEVGVYPVILSVEDNYGNKTKVTKYVTVKDDNSVISPDNKIILFANDIFTNVDEIKNISDINKFIIDNSEAFAKNMQDGSDVKVEVDNTNLYSDSTEGIYEAKLVASEGSLSVEKSIKIYVANGSDLIDDNSPYIYAKNIKVNKDDKIDNSMYEAIAFDRQDGDLSSLIVYSDVDTSKIGVYPAYLSVSDKDGHITTIKRFVTVMGDNSIISPDDNVFLDANDFEINELDLNATSDLKKMILDNSRAFAQDTNNGNILEVKVESTTLTKTSPPGEYEADISAISGSDKAIKKIKITLKDTKINLYAEDIYTNEDILSNQTNINDFLLNNANIKVDEITKTLTDVSVRETNLKNNSPVGIYYATFEVSNEIETVSKFIKIYVADGSDIIDSDKPYLFARDLTVSKDSIINNMDYQAIAFDRQDGDLRSKIKYPNVDTSKVGIYPADLSVKDSSFNKTNISKKVIVKDNDTIINDKLLLDADNIFTNVDTIKGLTDINKFIIDESNAVAYNKEDGSKLDVNVKNTTLTSDSKVGIYEATLKSNNGTSKIKKHINIYVANGSDIIDNDNPYLYAENIIINKGDKVNNLDYKAVAFDRQDGDLTNLISYPDFSSSNTGVYPSKLSVVDKSNNITNVIKFVTVLGDDSIISPGKDVFLEANDIYTNVNSIKGANDINKFIIDNSNAFAQSTNDANYLDVKVDYTDLLNTSSEGIYKATLSAKKGRDIAKKNISIYVASDNEIIDEDKPYLFAKNLIVNKNDKIDNEMYKAIAFDKQDGDLTDKINYPIIDTSKVGVYPAKFKVIDSDKNITYLTKYVTVKDDDSIITPDDKILLTANDIYTNINSIKGTSDINKFIIDNSHAFAQSMVDGKYIDVNVDSTTLNINSPVGIYEADLSASKGISTAQKTIKIYVADKDDIVDENKPYLYAKNLRVNKDDKIDNSMYKAIAFDKEDGDITNEIVYPTVDTSKKGVYPAEFSVKDKAGNETKLTKYVTVVEDDTIISPDDNVILEANDIYTNVNSIKETSDINKYIIDESKAFAQNTNNGEILDVNIDKTNLNKNSPVGIYEADLSANVGIDYAKKTIKIYVADKDDIVDEDKPYLFAKDIIVNKDGLINNNMYGAVAFDRQDGDLTSLIKYPVVDTSQIGEEIVELSVIDSDGNKTIKEVKVKVTDNIAPVINAFDEQSVEVKSVLSNDDVKKLFNVSVSDNYDLLDVKDVDVDMSDVNLDVLGSYTIKFSIVDNSGNYSEKISKLNVIDTTPPIVYAEDYKKVKARNKKTDEELLKLFNVSASDNYDGDLSKVINLDQSEVDYNIVGVYNVYFSVRDSSGNITKKTSNLEILSNEKPVFIGVDDTSVDQNTTFNNMDGVSVMDKEDGDITSDVKVEGKVNTQKPGIYELKYSVTDSDLNTTTANRKVTVLDKEAPIIIADKIEDIEVNSTLTTSQAKKLFNVSVTDNVDSLDVKDIDVDMSKVDLNKIGIYDISFSISDKSANRAEITSKLNVVDTTAPEIFAKEQESLKVGNVKTDDELKVLFNVSATDGFDGDLTDEIVVNQKDVNYESVGDYSVVFSVKDNAGNDVSKKVTLTILSNNKPVIYGAEDIEIYEGEIFDPLEGVTAYDVEDGDLTYKINEYSKDLKGSILGDYIYNYSVSDSDGNQVHVNRMVSYVKKPDNKPVIYGAEDIEVYKGEDFDPLEGVTAYDKEDGDLTNKIEVYSKDLKANIIKKGKKYYLLDENKNKTKITKRKAKEIFKGEKTFNYSVTDSNDNSDIVDRKVTFVDKGDTTNNKPVIKVDANKKIELGSDFDPLKGVTAYDKEDGDLTSEILVLRNEVDVNKVGNYEVVYEVVDSDLNKVEEISNVVVYSNDKDKKPDDQTKDEDDKDIIKKLITTGKKLVYIAIIILFIYMILILLIKRIKKNK